MKPDLHQRSKMTSNKRHQLIVGKNSWNSFLEVLHKEAQIIGPGGVTPGETLQRSSQFGSFLTENIVSYVELESSHSSWLRRKFNVFAPGDMKMFRSFSW